MRATVLQLEELGAVEHYRDGTRSARLELTGDGRALLDQAAERIVALDAELFGAIGDEQRAALFELLLRPAGPPR